MDSTAYTFIGTKIRLKPTKEQEILLWKSAGCSRFIYNWALDKNGLYFAFNPYSLGGYVNTAYFTLPANKLQGIVKPEWLRQSQRFHKTAKD